MFKWSFIVGFIMNKTLTVFISLLLARTVVSEIDCVLNVLSNKKEYNVYLNAFHWLTPINSFNGTRDFIKHGETVELNCDNGFIKDDFQAKSYVFECTDGKFNKTLKYEDLFCKSDFHMKTRTIPVSNFQLGSEILKCDGKDLGVYRVNVIKEDGSLKYLYTVCFDKKVMRTKFVFQPRRNQSPVRSHARPRDVWGFDYFGKDAREKLKLSEGYVSRIQRRRITNSFREKYNNRKKYPYTFNRGHLAPYSDFIEEEDRRASCEYLNVAPQWKELNGNSWSSIERETRDLVRMNPMEWEIYTGTYGSIPTTRGPLFVSPFFDQKGKFVKGFVPVPKLYWKLVYNTVCKNCSRAFIGVNNPEIKSPNELTDKYLICKPKANERGSFVRGSEFKGFVYECDVEEFLIKLGKDEGVVKIVT